MQVANLRLIGESEAVASINLPLRQSAVTIGTAAGNTIVVVGAASARHARIRRQGRNWLLEDLESSQGTYLNGIRVIGRQALRPGDLVAVGDAVFAVQAEAIDHSEAVSERPANRRVWLFASTVVFLALAGLIIAVARMPDALDPLAAAIPALPVPTTSPATATAYPTATQVLAPTASATATPAITVAPTRSPTVTPTSAPTATPYPNRATLGAVLTAVPSERAYAAMTAVADLGSHEQQIAVATAAVVGEQAGAWVDSLLGTATPVPPSGHIVYGRFSSEAGRYDLMLSALNSGIEVMLLPEASQPAISPDGTTVVYHSWQANALGLYAATIDGSQRWLLTREAHPEDGNPSWAPDGSAIAFASLSYGDGRSRIYIVPATGGAAIGICIGEYAAWSPDGSAIAFKGCIGGSCGIMLAAPDGSNQRLLSSEASDGAPAWSPNGEFIAFHSSRTGSWDIYIMRSDGSDVRQLTTDDTIETMPTWSPDGTYLAFRSNRDAEWAIWAVPAAGGMPTRLFTANLRPGDEMVETFAWLP